MFLSLWQKFFSWIFPRRGKIFFLAAFLTGCWLLAPYLTFQGYLSQGDHGRELYAAEAVMRGAVPYRDFFWNYGPFPLYYFALCFKLFGVSINSVLAGRAIFNLLSGMLIFHSLSLFIPLSFAYLAAVWFWFFNPDFHFTYCYTGGMTAFMLLTYALLLYIKKPRASYLHWALFAVFLLCLTKINFGIAALAGVLLSVFSLDLWRREPLTKEKQLFYFLAIFGLPFLIAGIYFFCLHSLPGYEIRQCFPFLPGKNEIASSPANYSVPSAIQWWLSIQLRNLIHGWNNSVMTFLFLLAFGLTAAWWTRKSSDPSQKKNFLAAILILVLFYFLSLHEFLLSGIPYRAAWAQPFSFLMFFLFFGIGFRQTRRLIQILLILALCFFVITKHLGYLKQMQVFKKSGRFFSGESGQVILGNKPAWIQTVQQTTRYLQTHLREDETFFALPYDPLYYFLTKRTSPTWLYDLFVPFANIPLAQEKQIIADLNAHKVNYILISNRQKSAELGGATFGVDYCLLLARYIDQNFREVATFGDWNAPAEWVNGHAVKILKRID